MNETLFFSLYKAKDEEELLEVLSKYPDLIDADNWRPLGGNPSNYGVVKNQQSNPIAALIEKITNSIDAILTKQCYLKDLDPKSQEAPKSMEEAVKNFFPDSDNWDLPTFRKKQAEEIQIIADGKGPRNKQRQYPTSVIIYDNGEGQHPKDFERTFLSLLSGNKNDIHFVQGKYNMGGSGAIVFCGKKRYQLIASKRYTKDGDLGFTLVREHPKTESDQAKETWYEYLLMDGKIPSFSISKLNLGLANRMFESGTIIKMYSYQFPKGYSGFAQDLNQSINEYLFQPALPVLTSDTAHRYPNNRVLENDLYGLRRRLNSEAEDYLEDTFSETFNDEKMGEMKVSCFVFKTKVRGFDLKRSKTVIQDRYFKNSMAVMFSLNGQTHGSYGSEFITRSLKLNLLKNHLLIHVDCTKMKYDFRKELFMASRDRLKDGEETQYLRSFLAKSLSKKEGRLAEIEKLRKQAVDIDSTSDTESLLKDFTKNLPLNSDLAKLLNKTFNLDSRSNKEKKGKRKPSKKKTEEKQFNPQRYPSFFKMNSKGQDLKDAVKIPLNGERTISFSTDVENNYFDRIDDPGDFELAILNIIPNETEGGSGPGTPKGFSDVFNVTKSSPNKGNIKISLNPKDLLEVGDNVQVKADLKSPKGDLEAMFWIKISEEEKKKEKKPKSDQEDDLLGLPELVFMYKEKSEEGQNGVTWEDVEIATSLEIDYSTVMVPDAQGEALTRIFVNMDSTVLKNFISKYSNPNASQIEIANRKYFTSVYFHTLFLYTISKNRGYEMKKKIEGKEELEHVDVGQYLKDIFDHYYSTFILNFGGMEELMEGLSE